MGIFKNLFGFPEKGYSQTRKSLLEIARFRPVPLTFSDDDENAVGRREEVFRERCDFVVKSTGESIVSAGVFWMPSVGELRRLVVDAATSLQAHSSHPTTVLTNVVGEARSMHGSDLVGSGDVVQAASQFNTLEFPTPWTVPENGIEQYQYDPTQGPACALACFAGTAYRNYLVPVSSFADGGDGGGKCSGTARGQTKGQQLNGLDRVEEYLANEFSFSSSPWTVQNGYAEVTSSEDLETLNDALADGANQQQLRDDIVSRVCIGVQEDAEVTSKGNANERKFVTQTYNSAIPIGYSCCPELLWKPMARLVLDATYEATLLVGALKTIHAIRQHQKQNLQLGTTNSCIEDKTEGQSEETATTVKRPIVFLTKVGGGVFENNDDWIRESISRAVERAQDLSGVGLEIRVVHFREIDPRYRALELP